MTTKTRRPWPAVLSVWLVLAAGATARDAGDDIFATPFEDLTRMTVVSASRHEQALAEAPAAVSVITRDDIRYSAAHTVPELLQYVVGLDGYTKTRTDMDVVARGMASDESPKMLVLVDGQPVNVTPYGGVQWPTLPLDLADIERIEVVRGPASAVYGADALGGVINILTLEASDRGRGVVLSYGEDGTQRHRAGWSTRLGERWHLALNAGFRRTENDDVDDVDARPDAPGNWGLKDHADIAVAGYRLDFAGEGAAFSSQGGVSVDEEGYNPAPGDLTVDRARKRTFWLTNRYRRDVGANRLVLRLGARNLWQENERDVDGAYEFKYRLRKGLGIDADAHYVVDTLPRQTLVVGVNAGYLAASRDIANDPPYLYDERETLLAAFAQDEVRLLRERFVVTLSGRFDKWSNVSGQFSPRVVANLVLADRTVNLRASWGTSFRRPGFDDNHYFVRWPGGWLKGSAVTAVTEDGRTIGGSELEPEQLEAIEVGVRVLPEPGLHLDLTAYRQVLDDVIGFEVLHAADGELNLGIGRVDDTVTMTGVEFEAGKRIGDVVSAFLNYTHQDVEAETGDGPAPTANEAPRNKVSGGVRYHGPVVVDLRARHVDATTFPEIPELTVDAYTTVDLAVTGRLGPRVHVKLSALNLLDDAHHEYPLYTQMTRKLLGTVRVEF